MSFVFKIRAAGSNAVVKGVELAGNATLLYRLSGGELVFDGYEVENGQCQRKPA
jgi:hypothetical protein